MAVKTLIEVYDILEANGYRDLSIQAVDLNGTLQTLITSENAEKYIKKKYATRYYPIIKGSSATALDGIIDFNESFRLWVANRQHNIDRQYQAIFNHDYSPIENVDRYETETIDRDTSTTYGRKVTDGGQDQITYGKKITDSGTDAVTYGKTDTRHIDGDTTFSKTGSIQNTVTKAGFNAPYDLTPDNQNVESYSGYQERTIEDTTDTNTASGSDRTTYGKTETASGTDSTAYGKTEQASGTDAGTDDSTRTLRVHGNVGVTSNVTLLKEDLEFRMLALAEMLLDNFMNDYTFYA